MKISKIANSIQPSLTRQLFDKAKQYENVIDFTLGDPDYQTPNGVKSAGCEAIMAGKTHYSANAGLPELRNAISNNIFLETNWTFNPDREVIVTVGAMQGLYLTLFSILDEGDEVIIPSPHWINYRHMTEMCNANPILVDTYENDGFVVKPEAVEKAITDKTVAIIINSPNNPTGGVYDKKTLEAICKLANDNDIYIIWDECYKSIVYDDTFVSILSCGIDKDKVIVVNSCSKKWSMTGWRLGYVVGSAELIKNMTKLQENLVACASLPSQYAAIEAFSNSSNEAVEMCDGFRKRRDCFVNGINEIDKLSCRMPKGTFYAMVNIKETGLGSEEFAYKLLDAVQVAVVPGITYGDCCEGYIRIAYTMNEDRIQEGVCRIKKFVESL
jgi:aminotransferase